MKEMKTWEIWRTRVDQSRPRWRSLIIDQEKRHLASGNLDWYIFEYIFVTGCKNQETTSIHSSSTDNAGWTDKKFSSWVRLDLLFSSDWSTLSLAFLYFGRQFSVVFLESCIAFAHTVQGVDPLQPMHQELLQAAAKLSWNYNQSPPSDRYKLCKCFAMKRNHVLWEVPINQIHHIS